MPVFYSDDFNSRPVEEINVGIVKTGILEPSDLYSSRETKKELNLTIKTHHKLFEEPITFLPTYKINKV